MIQRFISIVILALIILSCRKSDYLLDTGMYSIRDYGQGTGTVTWSRDGDYLIEGLVFVNDGQVLTIEPGTVIRFRSGQAENASALVVARGGKIMAMGTRKDPIIFTAEADDLDGSVGRSDRGLWGGLILLGNAPVNVAGGETKIEGIPYYEERTVYGGSDVDDNSGVLRYVSIRHGGTNIGEGNEINGLTLGGVGNQTEIDFVEVIANADDGLEIFGGTVNLRHMVVSDCEDDAFDYDLGWSGYGQFWLSVESDYVGDNLIEGSGGLNPVIGTPYSLPKIVNGTFVGNGNSGNGACVRFDRFAGGVIANSVFIHKKNGFLMERTDGKNDSFWHWIEGNLEFTNNILWEVGSLANQSPMQLFGIYDQDHGNAWSDYFETGLNEILDPEINTETGIYIPKQKLSGNMRSVPEAWFYRVDFKGSFGEDHWIDGWTLLAN